MLTEYEQERERLIQENNAMLQSLFSDPDALASAATPSLEKDGHASTERSQRHYQSDGKPRVFSAREVDVLLEREARDRAADPGSHKSPPMRYVLFRIDLPRRSSRAAKRRLTRASSELSIDEPAPVFRPRIRRTRVKIGGRIYDSFYGTSCHQCRQKTMDPKTHCATCPRKFDFTCLLNRYGETEEDASADRYRCPWCRGICNCSNCRRSQGHPPTGRFFH